MAASNPAGPICRTILVSWVRVRIASQHAHLYERQIRRTGKIAHHEDERRQIIWITYRSTFTEPWSARLMRTMTVPDFPRPPWGLYKVYGTVSSRPRCGS